MTQAERMLEVIGKHPVGEHFRIEDLRVGVESLTGEYPDSPTTIRTLRRAKCIDFESGSRKGDKTTQPYRIFQPTDSHDSRCNSCRFNPNNPNRGRMRTDCPLLKNK